MARFTLDTFIAASPEVCFDLSLDLGLHQQAFGRTDERIVGGKPEGLIGLHEFVTWEARHFGIRQRMTVGIVAWDRPNRFRDQMLKGPFKRFIHEHTFQAIPGGTLMRDEFEVLSPFQPLGLIVDVLVLRPYLRRLMTTRNAVIKAMAEAKKGPGHQMSE